MDSKCQIKRAQCAAIVALGFSAMLRFDELQNLRVNDISFHATHMSVTLCRRKNDQLRQGHVVVVARQTPTSVCPVRVVEQFIQRARHKPDQHLFGKLTSSKSGPGVRGKITYSHTRELLRQALMRIGVSPEGFGTHSLRSGGATAAARAGVPERLLQ